MLKFNEIKKDYMDWKKNYSYDRFYQEYYGTWYGYDYIICVDQLDNNNYGLTFRFENKKEWFGSFGFMTIEEFLKMSYKDFLKMVYEMKFYNTIQIEKE